MDNGGMDNGKWTMGILSLGEWGKENSRKRGAHG